MTKTPNYQGMFLRGAGSQTINHGSYGSVTHGTKLGEVQGDTIRNIEGEILTGFDGEINHQFDFTKVFKEKNRNNVLWTYQDFTPNHTGVGLEFNASFIVPTSEENRPVNVGVKYIVKAE